MDPKDRPPLPGWIIGAAALVVVVGALLYFGRPPQDAAVNTPGFPRIDMARSISMPTAPEPPENRLPAGNELRHEREEDAIDTLLDALAGQAKSPEAKAQAQEIMREFVKEPKLKKAHQDYMNQPPEHRRSNREFLATLKGMPEFRQLAARFASGGAAGSSSSLVTRAGSASPTLTSLTSVGGAGGSAGAKAIDPHQVAREWARKAVSGVNVASGRAGQSGGARLGFGADVASGQAAMAVGSSHGEANRGEPAQAARTSDTAASDKAGSLKDNKAITKLDKPEDAQTKKIQKLLEVYPFLADSFNPEELLRLANGVETYGSLWGACFGLNWFAKCLNACNQAAPVANNKQVSCALPGGTGWSACKDSFPDELKCISACNTQAPCFVPDDVWNRWCVSPTQADPRRAPPDACLGGTRQIQAIATAAASPVRDGQCASQGVACGAAGMDPCCQGVPNCFRKASDQIGVCDLSCLPETSACGPNRPACCNGSCAEGKCPGASPPAFAIPQGDFDSNCPSGYGPCKWSMDGDGSGQCTGSCIRWCVDRGVGLFCNSCPEPRPPPAPLCTCNAAMPCGAGGGGGPPGGCIEKGITSYYYGPDGGLLTVLSGKGCHGESRDEVKGSCSCDISKLPWIAIRTCGLPYCRPGEQQHIKVCAKGCPAAASTCLAAASCAK